MWEFSFWISLFAVGYSILGYPMLMAVLAKLWRRPAQPAEQGTQKVAIVLVVHNEENRVQKRLADLRNCGDDLIAEAVLVCDGCTDQTAARALELGWAALHIEEVSQKTGKAGCLNRGVARCTAPIVVFADARQSFRPDTIERLARWFDDPQMGAVSGSLEIAPSDVGAGQGVDIYWKLEKRLRLDEARIDSAIGCTGAVYAIRRSLYRPIPEDTLLDDVVIPMSIAEQGYRVGFDPEAIAYDPQELSPKLEKRRKVRTLAGNYQMLFRYPQWMTPGRCRLWWQLISHKYARLVAPLFLVWALLSNAVLALYHPFYRVLLAFQVGGYLLALVGIFKGGIKSRAITAPAGFLFLQIMSLRALTRFVQWRLNPKAESLW